MIYMPHQNLGCLGVSVGQAFYADVSPMDGRILVYARFGHRRYYLWIHPFAPWRSRIAIPWRGRRGRARASNS